MSNPASIKIGTLGSVATFAGEATALICKRFPEFCAPLYFPSMDECWSALAKGTVDAVVLGAERTGQPHHGSAVITRGCYVMGMMALPLRCNLYANPGTRRENIRKITGHGSLHQCTAYLTQHFPGATREMHGLNSVEAAKSVLAGDGSAAVVGSRSLPSVVPGLETIAEAIDDGAISNWWVMSSRPHFSDRPDGLVITGQFGPEGTLGEMMAAVAALGYRLATVAGFPADRGVSTYNYLTTFTGKGRRADVETAISPYHARLAGAFESRG